MQKIFLFIIFYWFAMIRMVAQDTLQVKSIENDKNIEKSDQMYKKIQKNSGKSGLFRELHKLIFRSINTKTNNNISQAIEYDLNRNFNLFQGKIIRKIQIETLDPFGYSERDSTKQPDRWERIGNSLHYTTRPVTIQKMLLFKRNQSLDSVIIKETERILRSESYIRRVLITPKFTHSPDSVDVKVAVLDSWSMFFDGDGSTNSFSARVRERNFLGLGHQITFRHNQEITSAFRTGLYFSYTIPNIYNTNINTYVTYYHNYERYYEKSWAIYRPYFSLYTRWAGGIELSEQTYKDYILHKDSLHSTDFKSQISDFWASTAVPIFKNYTHKDKVTNLIFSARYRYLNYLKSPEKELDSINFFSDKKLYLASVGISNVGYQQDRYVFRHQDIEDIPVGKTLSLITGFEDNLSKRRYYSGIRAMYGAYWNIGYVSTDIQMGSFLLADDKQTTIRLEANYFSNLFKIGNWNFRQFVKYRATLGLGRKNHIKDRITLNGSTGITEFNSPILSGTRKSILTFQTQTYSPVSWLGFRMSPFFTFEAGLIGIEGKSILKDEMFTKFALGFYVTNDYLLFGNFQFSFFFLPRVPGKGNAIAEFSSTRNDEFRLPNFRFRVPNKVVYE